MSIASEGNQLSQMTSKGRARSGRRRELINHIFFVVCLIITSIAIVALTVLLVTIAVEGWEGLTPEFLKNYGSRKPESAGVKAALWGSIWICCVCGIVALPIGVGTAIYLEEFAAKNRFTSFIRTNISNLAGVPSIVYGIINTRSIHFAIHVAGDSSNAAFAISSNRRFVSSWAVRVQCIRRGPFQKRTRPATSDRPGRGDHQ